MQIYITDVQKLQEKDLFERAFSLVAKARQEKIKSFYFPKDQALSLGAGLLLRYGLTKAGVKYDDLKISYTPYNKPILEYKPNLYFNLSHSGSKVLLGINDKPIGVDVEEIQPIEENLTKLVFTVKEQAYYNILNPVDRLNYFYKIWTLKEAYLKAIGKGLAVPMEELYLNPESPDYILYSHCSSKYYYAVAVFNKQVSLE